MVRADGVADSPWRPSLGAGLLWILPLAFLGVFFFYPLGSILAASFARSPTGWLAPWGDILSRPSFLRVLAFTFGQALASTALTLLVGLPGAYLVARYTFRGRSLLLALTTIPFVMPTVVVAAAFTAFCSSRLSSSNISAISAGWSCAQRS